MQTAGLKVTRTGMDIGRDIAGAAKTTVDAAGTAYRGGKWLGKEVAKGGKFIAGKAGDFGGNVIEFGGKTKNAITDAVNEKKAEVAGGKPEGYTPNNAESTATNRELREKQSETHKQNGRVSIAQKDTQAWQDATTPKEQEKALKKLNENNSNKTGVANMLADQSIVPKGTKVKGFSSENGKLYANTYKKDNAGGIHRSKVELKSEGGQLRAVGASSKLDVSPDGKSATLKTEKGTYKLTQKDSDRRDGKELWEATKVKDEKDSLDSEKRATMKRRFKGEQGRRLNRVETTSCMCRAAGIKLAKEEGIQLTNILNTNTKDYEKFMENYFYNKGLLFLSDELSATIKATNTVGEEYTTGMSRLVGAIINSKGIYYLYCTLDKLMKWIISYEKRRVSAITALLQNSNAATENQDFQTACSIQPKSIIIGKTCAMIPKIITGDKYGKNIKRAGEATITNKLMTLANLEEVYKHNYFVPTDTLGVELLSRTVTLTRDDLNQMIEMWLSEMTDKHTTVEAREYVEAYINDEESKTLVFPIIELEELVFQKAVKEKYHIVCERGTQDGISRAMGNKVIDFKDMNNESMPAHKYDDDGIRRDGINPLTHSGYWEEEQ